MSWSVQAATHDYSTQIHKTDDVVVSLLTFRIETLYCVWPEQCLVLIPFHADAAILP